MSVELVLREAKQVVARDHTAVQLSVDVHGLKVRNPIAPAAVAWSTVGALIKVAPRNPGIVAENKSPGNTDEAYRAYLLLEDAAVEQGFAHTVAVDEAGHGPVLAMFDRAIDAAQRMPQRARRKRAAGTGSRPRGEAAI